MKFFRAVGSYVLLCAALAACNVEIPALQSATYIEYVKGSPSTPVVLSAAQVQRLSTWLASHRSGWSRSIVSYVPKVLIQMRHVDGTVSSLSVFSRKAIADGSFGSYERELTESEGLEIIGLLGLNGR